MTIIHRYLSRYFLRLVALCVAAFVGIYLLIDFFEKIDDFIEHQAGVPEYLTYLLNSIPFIFVQILPLAVLTSVVLTLGGLDRTNEITAMRACGISLWKISRPLLGLALLLSVLLLLLNEYVVPWNVRHLNQLLEVRLKGRTAEPLARNEIWYRSAERIINITVAEPRDKRLQGIVIYSFDGDNRLRRRLDVHSATYREGAWQGVQVTERIFDRDSGELIEVTHRDRGALPLQRAPDDFAGRDDLEGELNFRQLADLVRQLERAGYDATRQRVDMHNRLAAPLTCLVMAFLGIPFAVARGRNKNIALGIGLSLGIGIIYFILHSLVTAFGYSRALPPILAAWSANLIFLLVAVWLLLTARE